MLVRRAKADGRERCWARSEWVVKSATAMTQQIELDIKMPLDRFAQIERQVDSSCAALPASQLKAEHC